MRKKPYYSRLLHSFLKNYEQPVIATIQLFESLDIKPPSGEINEYLLSHPDYPSLLSISDCLGEWEINNMALSLNKDSLGEYPLPMMVYWGGEFRVITEINPTHISFLGADDNVRELELGKFLSKWNGVALLADAEKMHVKSQPVIPKEKTKNISIPILACLSLFLMAFSAGVTRPFSSLSINLAYGILLFLKVAGITVTGLLLWYQVDKHNTALKKICGSKGNTRTGCDAILNSPQANLIAGLSWSEIGFFYFAGSFLSLLFFPVWMHAVALLGLAGLPFIAYSLIYQKYIAKKWCPLCLTVQAILFCEFLTSTGTGVYTLSIPMPAGMIFRLSAVFLLPVLSWLLLKPLIIAYFKNKTSRFELARIKHDPKIFKALLGEQKKLAAHSEGLGIVLGNKEARNTIIKVCNPYCGPCAKAHAEMNSLLANKDLKIQIIFTASKDPMDVKRAPVKHLLAIAECGNEDLIHKALDDWYLPEKKDYKVFAEKYRMNGELKKQDEKIASMADWCSSAGISFTPTFFVNGYELPPLYGPGDLKYLFAG